MAPSDLPSTSRLCCGKYVLAVIRIEFSLKPRNWSSTPTDGGFSTDQDFNTLVQNLTSTARGLPFPSLSMTAASMCGKVQKVTFPSESPLIRVPTASALFWVPKNCIAGGQESGTTLDCVNIAYSIGTSLPLGLWKLSCSGILLQGCNLREWLEAGHFRITFGKTYFVGRR